jgi:hypothetical protein
MRPTTTQILVAGVCVLAVVWALVRQQARIRQLEARAADRAAEAAAAAPLLAEVTELRTRVATDGPELERLRATEAEMKLEMARLRKELAGLKRSEAVASDPGAGTASADATGAGTKKPGLPPAMSGLMKSAIEQQTVGKLDRLKSRLNLTAEQEEGVRAVLTRQAERATAAAERMFAGDLSREELGAMDRQAGNPEEEIKALLTPEQLTAYEAYKQEENVSNARLAANAELLQMQGALGLSQEQQDRAFNALYDFTLDTLNGKIEDGIPKDGDPAAALTQHFDRKVRALEGVLTPEQMESYRKLQESQVKMIQDMLPKSATAPAKP